MCISSVCIIQSHHSKYFVRKFVPQSNGGLKRYRGQVSMLTPTANLTTEDPC